MVEVGASEHTRQLREKQCSAVQCGVFHRREGACKPRVKLTGTRPLRVMRVPLGGDRRSHWR